MLRPRCFVCWLFSEISLPLRQHGREGYTVFCEPMAFSALPDGRYKCLSNVELSLMIQLHVFDLINHSLSVSLSLFFFLFEEYPSLDIRLLSCSSWIAVNNMKTV